MRPEILSIAKLPVAAAVSAALLAAGVVLAADSAEPGQPPKPRKPPDCTDAMHHQFDFWAGDWEVRTPGGDLAGTNRIDAILAGCALLENWAGSKGGHGKSLNFYDAKTKLWNQVWIDENGGALRLEGGLKDGNMVLEGKQPGGASIERITWTPMADGRVRQLWESSKDDGKTWEPQFDGLYARRSAPAAP